MSFEAPDRIASPTGAALAVYHESASADAHAILLIHHGISEHGGRYGAFARFMAARGFHVYAHDHRGHGLTRAPDAPLGRFAEGNGADKVIADCLAVRDHAGLVYPGLPVVVFGHSMGGLIALNFAEACPEGVDALAVWNANFAGRLTTDAAFALLAVERMLLGSDLPSRLLPVLTFEAWSHSVKRRRTFFDWLSRVPEEVDAYVADPLCGFLPSVSMWRDVFTFIREGARRQALRRLPPALPIHLAGGSADPATDNGAAVLHLASRMRRLGLEEVTTRIFAGARHETLNDLDAGKAMAEFEAWALHALEKTRHV
jgi:alpha-beta hydrolase superfamily lysophospholipase